MLDLRLGRLTLRFGFSFFLLMAVLLVWDRDRLVLPVLLAVILHELGHLTAMLLCGVGVRGVCCTGSGVHILPGWHKKGGRIRELTVHLAGVAVNFLMAGLFFLFPMGFYGAYFSLINLLLGCFHLIPAGNLDGANALRCLLSRYCSEAVTRRWMRLVSTGCLGLLLWQMLRAASMLNFSAMILWCYLLICTVREY